MHSVIAWIAAKWTWITVLVFSVTTILSLSPLPTLPVVPGSDKTHHFIAYALLVFPAALANVKHLKWLVLLFILWSGAIELIQPYVNRYGEWLDLLANITGIGLGIFLALLLRKRYY